MLRVIPLSTELLAWRAFRNGRQLGAIVGLTPTPYRSDQTVSEQGISRSGNRRVRALSIEVAWAWLRYQPDSALSHWFHRRFGQHGRARRIGIVAVARKLLIALLALCGPGDPARRREIEAGVDRRPVARRRSSELVCAARCGSGSRCHETGCQKERRTPAVVLRCTRMKDEVVANRHTDRRWSTEARPPRTTRLTSSNVGDRGTESYVASAVLWQVGGPLRRRVSTRTDRGGGLDSEGPHRRTRQAGEDIAQQMIRLKEERCR
jgi:hypothetical protein